jgi:DNA-binding beta-propeller fold protein YncE
MKHPLLMATLPFLAALPNPAPASVETLVGLPKTVAISQPFSIDFDSKGVLHGVEFTRSNRVFRLTGDHLEFIAGAAHDSTKNNPDGECHDGPDPLRAVFHGMHDLQITRDDRVIIADSFHHRVRLLELRTGAVSTLAGTGKAGFGGDGGPALHAVLNSPMTVTLSPDGSAVYLADIGNHRVRMIDLATGLISTLAGSGGKGRPTDGSTALEATLGDTRAVTRATDGTLYVLLRGGHSLVAVKDGKVRTVVNASGKKGFSGDGGPAREATLNGPKYVAMDREGRVLIADTENHCIRRYSPVTGTIETVAGIPSRAGAHIGATLLETTLARPHGLRIGPDGRLYIADSDNNRVICGDYP